MSSNNLKILMVIKSKIVLKKELNLIRLKMKRRNSKNKNLPLKDSANSVKKFWEIRLRKFKLDKDFVNLHALW